MTLGVLYQKRRCALHRPRDRKRGAARVRGPLPARGRVVDRRPPHRVDAADLRGPRLVRARALDCRDPAALPSAPRGDASRVASLLYLVPPSPPSWPGPPSVRPSPRSRSPHGPDRGRRGPRRGPACFAPGEEPRGPVTAPPGRVPGAVRARSGRERKRRGRSAVRAGRPPPEAPGAPPLRSAATAAPRFGQRLETVRRADMGQAYSRRSRSWMLILGPADFTFGMPWRHVRWHAPPMTSRSPPPRSNRRERPPAAGFSRKRRGAPRERIANDGVRDAPPDPIAVHRDAVPPSRYQASRTLSNRRPVAPFQSLPGVREGRRARPVVGIVAVRPRDLDDRVVYRAPLGAHSIPWRSASNSASCPESHPGSCSTHDRASSRRRRGAAKARPGCCGGPS